MQLKKLFPIPKGNRKGVILAIALFVIQLIYFHGQDTWFNQWAIDAFGVKSQYREAISFLGFQFSHASSLLGLINIFVHAGLSILIIWQLYQDPFNTRFVIILSVVLIFGYLALYVAGKYSGALAIQMMSNKIRYFLSSPLKTIFSIPALKVRDEDGEDILCKSGDNEGKNYSLKQNVANHPESLQA